MYAWFDLYAPYLALVAATLALAAVGASIVIWRRLQTLQARYDELMIGANGGSLEAILHEHLDTVQTAKTQAIQARDRVAQIERASRQHLQHMALVRYNPFSHTGGDQSFVLALANAEGHGVVINSLHARDGTRIYAKPLAAWSSPYALTEEEQDAIAKARTSGQD